MRPVRVFCIVPIPILPFSFEERLPGLNAMPAVSFTLDEEFNVEFFGPHIRIDALYQYDDTIY